MDLVVGSGCCGDEPQESPNISSSWQPHHHGVDIDNNKDKKMCNRHTSTQIQLLEAFFKGCPHPNDDQKRQLSSDLGIDLKQIKFWFQNKRTQTKAQTDRADNSVLRAENERISCENYALKEALNNAICPACGGPPFGEDERNCSLDRLRVQNAQLKLEHERILKTVAKYTGKALPHIESLMDVRTSTSSTRLAITGAGASSSMMNTSSNAHNQQHYNWILGSSSSSAAAAARGDGGCNSKKLLMKSSSSLINGVEVAVENNNNNNKGVMMEMAARGLEELYKLLRINEPLWMKTAAKLCDTDGDDVGRYMLDRDSYQKLFQLLPPSTTQYCCSSTHHYESSKHTALVPMSSLDLVDAFLDSGKWSDLFPTIVSQARTIQVLETGTPNNRSGSVQLMYAEMHVLSPLVPSRQYYFLRCCQQIEAGLWVIADVSYYSRRRRRNDNSNYYCSWRLPSGCMIQEDLSNNGCNSKVTWVEHIAEDKSRYGGLYGGILSSGLAYGAERWVASLERQTQRLITMNYYLSSSSSSNRNRNRSRLIIMKVAGRMVKGFCAALLNMTTTTSSSSTEDNNMRVSVRQGGKRPGDPMGTIITASTSLWLPIPHQQLIDFLIQVKTRMLWDVLANGNPMYEVASISNADDGLLHPGNSISIMQPIVPVENTMLLQEICTDNNTGSSLLVYCPIDITAFTALLNSSNTCLDTTTLSLLPLGFTICASDPPPPPSSHENKNDEEEEEDGYSSSSRPERNDTDTDTTTKIRGSLLTAAFQMLVSAPAASHSSSSSDHDLQLQKTMDNCISTIHVLLNSTIHKIKATCCSQL